MNERFHMNCGIVVLLSVRTLFIVMPIFIGYEFGLKTNPHPQMRSLRGLVVLSAVKVVSCGLSGV